MSGQIVPLNMSADAVSQGATADLTGHADEGAFASVGQRLRAARISQMLTVADIAKTLKLSPHQVEALEADDWSRLPCNTIIRGFVRNYARVLGLNCDALMAMLDGLQMPNTPELEMPVGTNVRVPQEGRVAWRDYLRMFSGLAALGLAVSAYFFLPQDMLQSAVATVKAMVQARDATTAKAVPPAAQEKAPETVAAPATVPVAASEKPPVQPVAPVVMPAPAPDAPADPVKASARNTLIFTFSQPSWVEVRDRSGGIIFSQMSLAGSQREIEGQPPFALVVGNAAHVTLQYRGKRVDLSKRSKDDVARITVE